jgi:hypothetical protein
MVGQPVRGLVWLAASALALGACNLVSGASKVSLVDDDDGSSGSGANATGPGSGGSGGSTGTGPTTPMAAADGVTVEAVSLYQGIRRPLMEAGQPATSNVPIVMGRDALVRVFYSAIPEITGQAVTARLVLGSAEPIDVQTVVGGVSQESDLDGTLNFTVPGALLAEGSFRVEVLMPQSQTSGTNVAAVYPADGQQPITVQSSGSTLKIVLVPVQYNADGSGRLPDTSPTQVQRYRDRFYRMYPIPDVQVEVLAPVAWSSTISANGSGWSSLLNAIYGYRQQTAAAPDEYYYGIFASAPSFSQYCAGGCVAGLSLLAGPNDPMDRVGIGVGFGGDGSTETAAHEVGHQHGRGHAPCQTTQGLDPGFPHSNGSIGDWGYDLVDDVLVSPQIKDFMSYCDPTWVSDYNFINLFNRMKLVNNADFAIPETTEPTLHERISISPDGVTWEEPLSFERPLSGALTTVTVEGPNGSQQLTGHFYPYSHLEGGVLMFPSAGTLVDKASFVHAGQLLELTR